MPAPVVRRALPLAALAVVVALLVPALAGAEGTHDLAKPGTAMKDSAGTGSVPRGVAFRAEAAVAVESFGIEGVFSVATTLAVEVRDLDAADPAAIVASGSLAVAAAAAGSAPAWHDVPLTWTFEQGRRYDVRFASSAGWTGSVLRYQDHDNPNLNPGLGFVEGPFLVLDGGGTVSRQYSYANTALMHFHAIEAAGDATPPSIEVRVADGEVAGPGGWYNAAGSGTDGVTVAVAAGDDVALAGVLCTDGGREVANRPDGAFALTVGDGHRSIACTATDSSGNTATSASLALKVDQTAPSLAPRVTPNPVPEGGDATAWGYAEDVLSGVTEQVCEAPATSSPGHHAVTCRAADGAGNEGVGVAEYDVLFTFHGFHAPVVSMPAVNAAKGGSTVPVKFGLDGFRGLDILEGGAPTVRAADCTTQVPSGAPAAAGGSLRYDADADRYTWQWRTDKGWTGCRMLTVTLTDGSTKSAMFSFR